MTVRAVQIDRVGGPEVIVLREVPTPVAGPGQVLVRTVASSLNPIDRKMRARENIDFPVTLGWDVAGVVIESEAPEFTPGDRVIAMTNPLVTHIGAWTDIVALDARNLAPAPATASLTDAAALPLAGLTAQQAWNKLTLSRDARVLVIGAAGALGGYLIEIAKHAGHAVDGLVSRAAGIDLAKNLGAKFVTADLSDLPRHGYDAIIDTAGLPAKGIDVSEFITEKGEFVAMGHNLSTITRAHEVMVQPDPAGLRELVQMVDDGNLTLRVCARYALGDVHAAHEYVEAGGLPGKVVLML